MTTRLTEKALPVDKLIGAKIAKARRLEGLTQDALASMIDITRQQIQKYETGVNRLPVSRLIQIACALGYEPSAFLQGIESAEDTISEKTKKTKSDIEKLIRLYRLCDDRGRKDIINFATAIRRRLAENGQED